MCGADGIGPTASPVDEKSRRTIRSIAECFWRSGTEHLFRGGGACECQFHSCLFHGGGHRDGELFERSANTNHPSKRVHRNAPALNGLRNNRNQGRSGNSFVVETFLPSTGRKKSADQLPIGFRQTLGWRDWFHRIPKHAVNQPSVKVYGIKILWAGL